MDRLERRIIQLKIEREALNKESDEASRKRLGDLEQQLSELEREFADLEEVWKAEKAALQGTTAHQGRTRNGSRLELETAHRASDLARMSELQYGRIPELEKQLESALQAESFGDDPVCVTAWTAEEVAEIVSKWTGIPVSKMLEGEKDKFAAHGVRRTGTRRRPGRSGDFSSQCHTPLAWPACRIPGDRSDRSCSWGQPVSERRKTDPGRSHISCSIRMTPWFDWTCPNSWKNIRSRG